jgi:hypothetical protein
MNVAFVVIVTIVGVYALVRATTRNNRESAQLDAGGQAQATPMDDHHAGAHEEMDIHSRV